MSQPVRFLISGGGAALLFVLLSWALVRSGASPFTGTLVAYLAAFAAGYTAQRFWTFGAERPHAGSLPRYLVLQLGCALLAGLLSHATAGLLGLRPFAMALTTAAVAGAVSYVVSARWVFAGEAARTR